MDGLRAEPGIIRQAGNRFSPLRDDAAASIIVEVSILLDLFPTEYRWMNQLAKSC